MSPRGFPGTPGNDGDLTPDSELPRRKLRISPEDFRLDRFLDMGFSHPQAAELAQSKDSKDVFIYWGDVKAVLDAGCDHNTAFDIFCEGVVLG